MGPGQTAVVISVDLTNPVRPELEGLFANNHGHGVVAEDPVIHLTQNWMELKEAQRR